MPQRGAHLSPIAGNAGRLRAVIEPWGVLIQLVESSFSIPFWLGLCLVQLVEMLRRYKMRPAPQ